MSIQDLNQFSGADVKVTGEENERKLSPIINEPGNYEGYLTSVGRCTFSSTGKVTVKLQLEVEDDREFTPVESATKSGRVADVAISSWIDPSNGENKQTAEFYKNLGIIAAKVDKVEEFNKLDRSKFGDFLQGFIDLVKDVKLAFAVGAEEYLKADKNDSSKVYKQYGLKFNRFSFVKESIEDLPEFNEDKMVKRLDPASMIPSQQKLYEVYSGDAPVDDLTPSEVDTADTLFDD